MSQDKTAACHYCGRSEWPCHTQSEPGYVETDNNGPIVPCWLCNREEWKKTSDAAE